MFKIIQTSFTLDGGCYKQHFVGSKDVAVEVCNDLEYRFGGNSKIEEVSDQNEVNWDPGGAMMMHDKHFTFDLGSITVCCLSQHFSLFAAALEDYHAMPLRGTDTKYVKLHGAYLCICLTPEEFNKLYEMAVTSEQAKDYARQGEEAFNDLLNRIDDVKKQIEQDANLRELAGSIDVENKKNLN